MWFLPKRSEICDELASGVDITRFPPEKISKHKCIRQSSIARIERDGRLLSLTINSECAALLAKPEAEHLNFVLNAVKFHLPQAG